MITRIKTPPHEIRTPEYQRHLVVHFMSLLFNPSANSSRIVAACQKLKTGGLDPVIKMVCGNLLDKVSEPLRHQAASAYLRNFSEPVIAIYRQMADKQINYVPRGFWQGRQGRLNFLIIFYHILETVYGFARTPDGQLAITTIGQLEQALLCQEPPTDDAWKDFFKDHKLLDRGFQSAFRYSLTSLLAEIAEWQPHLKIELAFPPVQRRKLAVLRGQIELTAEAQQLALPDFLRQVTRAWLIEHSGHSHLPLRKVEIFKLLFPDKFADNTLAESMFNRQGQRPASPRSTPR